MIASKGETTKEERMDVRLKCMGSKRQVSSADGFSYGRSQNEFVMADYIAPPQLQLRDIVAVAKATTNVRRSN